MQPNETEATLTGGDAYFPSERVKIAPRRTHKRHRHHPTNTLTPNSKRQHLIPKDNNITYANFVCSIRPQKSETHRVRMTAGGDRLNYTDYPISPTVSITDANIHFNSTISDTKRGARYMTLDIKN